MINSVYIYGASLMAQKVKNQPANAGDVDSIPWSRRFSVLGEAPWLKPPPWPGSTATMRMSRFTIRGPGEEHGTNKTAPARRGQDRSQGDTTRPTTSQNPRWQPSWLSNAWTTRKDSESEWLVNPGTNPITINPRLRATRQSGPPGLPHPAALCPGALPNKISCFLSTCVSSDNSFLSVRQGPSFRPWKRSPFLQLLEKKIAIHSSILAWEIPWSEESGQL